jgi:hypothetical protein
MLDRAHETHPRSSKLPYLSLPGHQDFLLAARQLAFEDYGRFSTSTPMSDGWQRHRLAWRLTAKPHQEADMEDVV